jgi:carbon storage regulator CsrA
LGIEAPTDVTILREEILQAITSENRRASATEVAADRLEILPVRQRPS